MLSLLQVEELDAELSELERQQRAADAAREELNRRQGRIKVGHSVCVCALVSVMSCRCMYAVAWGGQQGRVKVGQATAAVHALVSG
jgi:hypothetical protein